MGVTKYYGPPGTGKTTTLLNIIEKSIDEGIAPERIAFISFSKKAARKVRPEHTLSLV